MLLAVFAASFLSVTLPQVAPRQPTSGDARIAGQIVDAESHDAAAKSFERHPHLQIPESSIEIMEIHALPGM